MGSGAGGLQDIYEGVESGIKNAVKNYRATRTGSLGDILADVDKWSLVEVSQRQKQMITDKLSVIKQRSGKASELMRKKGFSEAKEAKLIERWEKETGMSWVEGATPHHVIPLKNGGVNEWWNLIPVKRPHQGTIHGTGSALRKELPYKLPPGTITSLE